MEKLKKFRGLMSALVALVMVLVGCLGTAPQTVGAGRSMSAALATAPVQTYVPLTGEEVQLAKANNLLLRPSGSTDFVTTLDPQTTKAYVDAVRGGLWFVKVSADMNAQFPYLPPLVAQMGRSLLDNQGTQMQTKLAQYLVALGELSAARQAQLILAERLEAAEPACEGNEPSQVKGRLLLAKTVYGQQQTLMDNLRAQGSMVGQNTLSAAQQQLNALRAELQSVEAEYGRCRALLQTLDAQAREQHTRTDSAEQSAEEIRRYYQSMREAFGAQLGPYQAAVQAVAKPQ